MSVQDRRCHVCARRMTRAELAAVTDAQGKGGVRTAPERPGCVKMRERRPRD